MKDATSLRTIFAVQNVVGYLNSPWSSNHTHHRSTRKDLHTPCDCFLVPALSLRSSTICVPAIYLWILVAGIAAIFRVFPLRLWNKSGQAPTFLHSCSKLLNTNKSINIHTSGHFFKFCNVRAGTRCHPFQIISSLLECSNPGISRSCNSRDTPQHTPQ